MNRFIQPTGSAGQRLRASFAFALAVLGVTALFGPEPGSAAPANCGLTAPAFCENFDQGPSPVRGRAGDLDPNKWGVGRLAPSDFSRGGAVNPVGLAPIPACRSTFSSRNVYPPDDTLVCDPSGSLSAQVMVAAAIQVYGNNSYMIRQPFDFANRTGKIVFDADLWGKSLGTYIAIDLTEDPVPAPTFREYENFETGPVPRRGVMIKFQNMCDPNVAPGKVLVYDNYIGSEVNPSFSVQGTGCAQIQQGSLNHVEIQISRTSLEIFVSDYSRDNGNTFPNFRRLYAATLNLPFTRGYVHVAARNHASSKYGFGPVGIYHLDNIGFDGPVIQNSRSYEVPDNTRTGQYDGHTVMNLGYTLHDGTTGRPAGIYDPVNRVSALPIQGVDLSGASSAQLTLNVFANANNFQHTATTAWGWQFRFNGGTWRNRPLTAAEAQAMNTVGAAGNMTMMFDVPIGDLRAGTNTLEMLPVGLPMDLPPAIANIDLVLAASQGPPPAPPANVRILP
jgi:hypothetical protein